MQIGFVTIGRNEGDRLIRCLNSLQHHSPAQSPIVYVDSGSTDGSVNYALDRGIHVVELDMTESFTMARGRNAGFKFLVQNFPELQYIQFLDGDCEMLPGWIEVAKDILQTDETVAVVCGRRREKFPSFTIYNRLADMEWNTPIGNAKACGGDMLARIKAIQDIGGYNSKLICGEEPEMCIRLRQQGWRIQRIDADMTSHDAAMTHFRQWWIRSIRGGWAVAEGKALHGQPPELHKVKETKSGWFWGVVIPLLVLTLLWPTQGLSLLLLSGYLVLGWRIYHQRRKRGDCITHSLLYAYFCTLSKFPQAIGQAKYWMNRLLNQSPQLIEYKLPQSTAK